jgi:hypothetical protein
VRWFILVLAIFGWGVLAASQNAEEETFVTPTVALLPIQDHAGDTQATIAVRDELLWQLRARGLLTATSRTRDVMRKHRVRNGDDEDPALLSKLALDLDVGWIISVTIHDAERSVTPRMTLTARAYDGETGEIFWASYQSGSGIDRRSVLGYGVLADLEPLAKLLVERLMADLGEAVDTTPDKDTKAERKSNLVGPVAILPFDSITEHDGTVNSETITQLARAELQTRGVDLVPAGCLSNIVRSRRVVGWGSIDQETRAELWDACGAKLVLTGTVERYYAGGSGAETQPFVAFGMRLVRADTGQILWTGGLERRGWARQSVFRFGRVHSRGDLAGAMMQKMIEELMQSVSRRLRREAKERG